VAETGRAQAVIDASVLVDLLAGTDRAARAREHLSGVVLHAPAHLDAEVLSALGRLNRSGLLTSPATRRALNALASAPVERHLLAGLLAAAWTFRHELRLTDALYVALSERLRVPLLTSDARLGRAYPPAVVIADDS
jgi:predicted nucleic acid-binding protein